MYLISACGGVAMRNDATLVKAQQPSGKANGNGYGYSFEEPASVEAAPAPEGPEAVPPILNQSASGNLPAENRKQAVAGNENPAKVGVGSNEGVGPLLIYQAKLALAVFEVDKSLDAVEELAKKAGGYLVQRHSTTIVVRIPAKGFDGTLKTILKMGDVLERDLEVEDVTAKVRDLEARLMNAEAVRKRLVELLNGANKTEDALSVERELARVTENIEQMKAQLKLLSELVTYSTITVRFEAPQAENLDKRFKLPFPWLDELGLSNLLSL
jgi:hypothetical protein